MGIREDDKRYSVYAAHRLDLIRYATPILGSREDAEEIFQEAFLKFVPQQADTPQSLKAYLFRIVRNLALDVRKRRRHDMRERPDDAPFWGLPQDHPTPEDHALFCDEVRQVTSILATLPEDVRVALEMHRFGGYKLEEIAEHLQTSVASVHRLIRTGIAEITRKMA